MSKWSDYSTLGSILGSDFVMMLRTSLGTSGNVKATVTDFVASFIANLADNAVGWAKVNKTGSDLADLATKSHTDLTDIGTNTHAQIDSFIAANNPGKIVNFSLYPSDIDVEISNGYLAFSVPALLNGLDLTAALASVHTVGSGTGETQIQIRRRRAGADVDMLSTKITIGVGEYYIADGVINTSNDDLATGDQIYIDVDQLTTTPPKGLSVVLTFS